MNNFYYQEAAFWPDGLLSAKNFNTHSLAVGLRKDRSKLLPVSLNRLINKNSPEDLLYSGK